MALIVIGPERLPKTARTLGHLFGRLQRYVNDVKADINREMELDELRKLQREVQTRGARISSQSVTTTAQRREDRRAQRRARAQRRRRIDAGQRQLAAEPLAPPAEPTPGERQRADCPAPTRSER